MVSRQTAQTIENLYRELQSLLPLTAEQQDAFDKKIRLEFHYNTNHIEGNTLTYGETQLYLIFGQVGGSHSRRDYEEMGASDVALKLVEDLANDNETPLTEAFIKHLNEIILVSPFYKEAVTADGQTVKRKIEIGQYKQYANHVRLENGEIFHYTNPENVAIEMGELLQWYREEVEKKELTAYEIAAVLHYRFVRIHPFDDGNGRISRLLMNYVLIKNGYPPVIIKSSDKPNYLLALNQADTGNIPAFVDYIATQLIWSLELKIKAAKGESLDEEDDWKKRLALFEKELSNKKTVEISKTARILRNLISNKIVPFVYYLQEELSQYRNLFLNEVVYVDSEGYVKDFSIHGLLTTIENEDEVNHLLSNFLHFTIGYKNFKKNGVRTFDIAFQLYFDFSNLSYNVRVDTAQILFTKFYDEFLTEDEQKVVVQKAAESLFERMQSELKRANS